MARYSDFDELEKYVQLATPGRWMNDAPAWAKPWEVGLSIGSLDAKRPSICTLDVVYGNTETAPRALDKDYVQCIADAKYIAAARPEVVIKLLEELHRLRGTKLKIISAAEKRRLGLKVPRVPKKAAL